MQGELGDIRILFAARGMRLFAYGLLSVVLALYLAEVGLGVAEIGLLLTLTLLGDTGISLWLSTSADRLGRRRTLIVGALLMVAAGVVFLSTGNFVLLVVAATVGVISPSGGEIGPFLSVEQAALSQVVGDDRRTAVFAWYNLIASFATALGALVGGLLSSWADSQGLSGADTYRPVLWFYSGLGLVMTLQFAWLSPAIEVQPRASIEKRPRFRWGLHSSHAHVWKLSWLFALDAFGGGFVVQSLVAYWFQQTFQLDLASLGLLFLGANLLAGVSSLAAARLARTFGLVNTMVFTHLPSNVLLMLIPLVSNVYVAMGLLLLRSSISQMDVPTRQAYTMAIVEPDERSAAAGITAMARSLGASLAPSLASPWLGSVGFSAVPFLLAGGIKILYDLLLYREFSRHRAEFTR